MAEVVDQREQPLAGRTAPLTLLRMTARNLYRRKVRTALTALGVSVGVIAIVALTAIMRGNFQQASQAIRSGDADLVVFQGHVASPIFSILNESQTQAELLAVAQVRQAVGVLWYPMPAENQPIALVLGARRADMPSLGRKLVQGRLSQDDDEVVLGAVAERVLHKHVGDTVTVQGRPYRVVGISSQGTVFLDGAILMSLSRLQQLTGRQGCVTVFRVHVQPGAAPEIVGREIEQRYPELVALTGSDELGKLGPALDAARGLWWAVTFVAVVIGSIIVANTMWMSVMERTREIGVLRAVGWARRRVMGMILVEAVGVGLLACLVGSLLGAGLAELAANMPVTGSFISPDFGPVPFLLALAVAVVLSVLGALAPAWRAGRISPAEALRYE